MDYLTYRRLKEELNKVMSKNLKEIKLGNLLSADIWIGDKLSTIHIIKKVLVANIFESYEVKIDNRNQVLFIDNYELNRKDHTETYNKVKELIEEHSTISVIRKNTFNNIKLNIIDFVKNFRELNGICNLKLRLYFSSKLVEYKKIFDEVNNSDLKRYKLVVSYADMLPVDNLVIQIAKSKKVVTATLQHGQYYINNNQGISCINYENFISDYMLVWGENTFKELEKIKVDSNRVIITGNPKYCNVDRKNAYETSLNEEKNIFVLMFEGIGNKDYININKELIEIAEQISEIYNLKFYIKLHPTDNKNNYKSLTNKTDKFIDYLERETTINDISKLVDFSIVHLSSVYMELSVLNTVSFRYKRETEVNFLLDKKHEFSNCEEFKERYDDFIKNKYLWYKKIEDNREKYMITTNVNERYKTFFNKFLKG